MPKTKKKLSAEEMQEKLREKTSLNLIVDLDMLMIEVDRGPRVDHGGGDDGDEWLDDNQQEELEDRYKEKHKSKISSLESALKELKIEGQVSFDYGEKGHCTIYVQWK